MGARDGEAMAASAPSHTGTTPQRGWRRYASGQGLFALLIVLSICGMAIADFSARTALVYWLCVVPVFIGASLYAGWSSARARGETVATVVGRHALHWAVLPPALYLIYLLEQTGRLNREDAGLVALLALAVTTFLAGVHFDWRLAVLGGLLAVTAAASAFVEEFFWLLLLPALAAGAIMMLWKRRDAKSPTPPAAAPPSPPPPAPAERAAGS